MSGWKVSDGLATLEAVAAKDVQALAAAGIATVGDLLAWFPRRYEDRRRFDSYPQAPGGEAVCLRGTVVDAQRRRFGGKRQFYEVIVQEGGEDILSTNKITCRWFNMPYIHKLVAVGHEVILYGKPKESGGRIVIDHPEFEVVQMQGGGSIHVERIVPVYRNVTGIPQRRLREMMFLALGELDGESVQAPYEIDRDLPRLQALRDVHFPEKMHEATAARRYFALEEFFVLQLNVLWRRRLHLEHPGRQQGRKTGLLKAFYESLPFDLTGAQKRSVKEVVADMREARPMNRLLQGDVGSGKTFVAMCAMLLAIESGSQAALMAPTQILAEQHYLTFRKWLEPLGVRIALVTAAKREGAHLELEGHPQIVIGTHALIYDTMEFEDLGLVVIDEQHKFGVAQRGRLIRQGIMPDVLVMTATPIPRTLTLTIYGDLDVSLLDELPAGRGKIITGVREKAKVSDVTKFLKEHLAEGRQAYLVYPLVEESGSVKAQSATVEYEKWVKRLKGYEVGLLHGQLPPEEKEAVMGRFREGEVQALVATTVVEVGVDVPNANIMVIHNAERFGLAQLHQLRGRIGRGEHKSYCILLTDGKSPDGMAKLKVMEATGDGFKIAEEDLLLRGPGEVLGTAQSGMTDLRFVDFLADTELVREARRLAEELLDADPDLAAHPELREKIREGREPVEAQEMH
ncbi:MAG: ATP-dependent DNA helicase RecG [Akkermansiaceae bacterium]|nr:ATP-dependent DNA helicase RecG [Akkermansiaceae bacterium]